MVCKMEQLYVHYESFEVFLANETNILENQPNEASPVDAQSHSFF